jgi:hypothetical protein
MKTIRLSTFETNSSSTHTLTITSGKKWDEFENGNSMYSIEHEDLFSVSDMYKMFLEGDQDGDYNSEEYEKYLAENHAEKLTAEEFEFVIQNYKVARRCYENDRYKLTESFQKEITDKFGENTHLNREVFEIIGQWLSYYGMQTCDEWKDDDEMDWFSYEQTIEGVRVVAFGKYGWG